MHSVMKTLWIFWFFYQLKMHHVDEYLTKNQLNLNNYNYNLKVLYWKKRFYLIVTVVTIISKRVLIRRQLD